MKEFEHYGDVTNKTPCRFCGFEFRGSVAQLEHHADKKHRMPNRQARQLVIAEPDAVVDDNVVVADADAAALRDLQGPDYFENVAQEQQGPARRQRKQQSQPSQQPSQPRREVEKEA